MMTPKTRYLVMWLVATLFLAGCGQISGDYMAVSSISNDGFARDAETLRTMEGREVRIWGFVDHGNMYGDEGAKAILGDWWSGDGPTATTWRFNLKASAGDAVGHSFEVRVSNDPGRDDLLTAFLADARAQKPTEVFVTGRLFTFGAPTNGVPLTSLRLEVRSSDDVLLDPSQELK